eukprot:scaffold104948_cov29-Tisochrysis_lutea.AAC.3
MRMLGGWLSHIAAVTSLGRKRVGATGTSLTVIVAEANEAGRLARRTVDVPGLSPRISSRPIASTAAPSTAKLTSGVTSKPSAIAFSVVV